MPKRIIIIELSDKHQVVSSPRQTPPHLAQLTVRQSYTAILGKPRQFAESWLRHRKLDGQMIVEIDSRLKMN